MRLKITISPTAGSFELPTNYNHLLQGLIYNQMDQALAAELHDGGYHGEGDKRKFKLFSFSRLVVHRGLEASFFLSSVDSNVLRSVAERLLVERPPVRLGSANFDVKEVAVVAEPQVPPVLRVRTLSPITTYSTFRVNGRKRTHYYSPQQAEAWSDALVENLKRKARALRWEADPDKDLQEAWIKPCKVRRRTSEFKGTVIEAWSGTYEVKLPAPYFRLAYDAGLGAKNAQGFGMIEEAA